MSSHEVNVFETAREQVQTAADKLELRESLVEILLDAQRFF